MGGFRTMKAAIASARKSHPKDRIFLQEIDWNYETDAAIELPMREVHD